MAEIISIPKHQVPREPCWETRSLVERLVACRVGEVLPYTTMQEVAGGRDVRRQARHLLDTARKLARKQGLVFRAVPRTGLVRLNDAEIVQTMESKRRHVFRTATVAKETLACARVQAVEEALQMKAAAYAGLFAAIGLMSQFQTMNKVRRLANTVSTPEQAAGKIFQLFAPKGAV
jgi:hypothetical protein